MHLSGFFFFGSFFRSFLIYVLIVIKALSESPQTQGWQWQAAWGHLYWRWLKKKWWKKNRKVELKTVPSRFWKAQWQAVPDLPKSGRYNAKSQAGKGPENTRLKIELVFRFVEREVPSNNILDLPFVDPYHERPAIVKNRQIFSFAFGGSFLRQNICQASSAVEEFLLYVNCAIWFSLLLKK